MWWQLGVSIFQTLVFVGSVWWLQPVDGSMGSAYQIITLDSVYSTVDFLVPVILELLSKGRRSPEGLTWSQSKMKLMAKQYVAAITPMSSFLDRYLVYIAYIGLSWMIQLLTYGTVPAEANLLGLLLPIPWIIRPILQTETFQTCRRQVLIVGRKLWRQLICLTFAAILNQMVVTIFDQHPHISRKEISAILKDSTYDHIDEFVKIFIVTHIFQHVQDKHQFTRPILRRLYNYGAVLETSLRARYEDPFSQITDPREKIRAIVMKRRFEQFYNPHILMILNKLYSERHGQLFDEFLNQQLNYGMELTALFCTLYTAASFFRQPLLLLPISLLFAQDWVDAGVKVLGTGVGFILSSYFGGAVLCSFGTLLLINRLTIWLWQQLTKKIRKYTWLICHNQSYNREIIVSAVSLMVIAQSFPRLTGRLIIGLELTLIQHPWILGWFLVLGSLSDYATGHMIILALALYLGINLQDYRQVPSDIVTPNLIMSYRIDPNDIIPARSLISQNRSLMDLEPAVSPLSSDPLPSTGQPDPIHHSLTPPHRRSSPRPLRPLQPLHPLQPLQPVHLKSADPPPSTQMALNRTRQHHGNPINSRVKVSLTGLTQYLQDEYIQVPTISSRLDLEQKLNPGLEFNFHIDETYI
jgi:hypothetical protein